MGQMAWTLVKGKQKQHQQQQQNMLYDRESNYIRLQFRY